MTISEAYSAFIKEKYAQGESAETIKYYNYNIPKFIEWCCEFQDIEDITELNSSVFDNYKIFLLSTNLNIRKTSLQSYSRAIKTFLNWINNNMLDNDIGKLSLIKAEVPNIVPLSDVEVKILLNCFDDSYLGIRNHLIVLLMVDSGLRRGEVVCLKTENINVLNNTMLIMGKGNKERIVPFGEETKKYICRYLHINNEYEKYFFQKLDGTPITNNTIKMFFQNLKEDTGIKRLYPHLLRHTFATNYILYGGDVEELRILLGHSCITMTQKYVHLAAQQRILNQRYHSHIDKLICEYEQPNFKNISQVS